MNVDFEDTDKKKWDTVGNDEVKTSRLVFMLRLVTVFVNSFRSKPLCEQMKTKNFYVVLLLILAALTTIWIFVDPTPSIHTIVSETHKHISNIKNIPSNIRSTKKEMLEVDHKYLEILGFNSITVQQDLDVNTIHKVTRVSKPNDLTNIDPVIVVPVLPSSYEEAQTFFGSVQRHFPEKFVLYYDLGLGGKESTQLRKACNITKNNCEVKLFQFNKYPSHVRSLSLRAYLPICIQESLLTYHGVIWADPVEYFVTKDVSGVIARAKVVGILAWTNRDKYTTSSMAYPKMFAYFDEKPEHYYFHAAVKTSHLIIYNTDFVQTNIMLPWVKCALVEECISPMGSQNTGYCYEQRPKFLYSGCHYYEQAALNLILGKVFSYDEQPYSTIEEIFGSEQTNKTVTLPVTNESNDKLSQ